MFTCTCARGRAKEIKKTSNHWCNLPLCDKINFQYEFKRCWQEKIAKDVCPADVARCNNSYDWTTHICSTSNCSGYALLHWHLDRYIYRYSEYSHDVTPSLNSGLGCKGHHCNTTLAQFNLLYQGTTGMAKINITILSDIIIGLKRKGRGYGDRKRKVSYCPSSDSILRMLTNKKRSLERKPLFLVVNGESVKTSSCSLSIGGSADEQL